MWRLIVYDVNGNEHWLGEIMSTSDALYWHNRISKLGYKCKMEMVSYDTK